jgi:multidrug resistance efflux pump
MIEVLALAGAVTKIATSVSSAVRAGKDITSVMPAFGKLANLEAQINIAEAGRHKGPLGRLTSTEEEGFAIAQAKMKYKQVQDELRSVCHLYGPPGMWDLVVREQSAARLRKKKALEEEAERRDKLFWILSVAAGIVFFFIASGLLLWGADKAVNG